MSRPPVPDLSRAAWLADPAAARVFRLFAEAGEEARAVGGAVRNALLGLPVRDVDFATTALPQQTVALAEAAGIKAVPTGMDHGTVTLVMDKHAYEVTTLREDVETDGRRAVVKFGRDWRADAERRDFTMNALSADASGRVHDPVGGYPDIVARRVRFIGDPDRRIAEDRLRILRLFRFHAAYGEGPIDAAGLGASIRAREGIRDLSAERIGQEMRKIAVATRAAETAAAMQDSGILGIVLGGVGYAARFARGVELEAELGLSPSPAVRLALLTCRVDEDAQRVTARLRLSNAERDRMLAMLAAERDIPAPGGDMSGARRALYAHGPEAYRDGVLLAATDAAPVDAEAWRPLCALPDAWPVPRFPLGGRDVAGIQGRAVGEALRAVEAWWVAEDFAPDEDALRGRLQQMIAAAQ